MARLAAIFFQPMDTNNGLHHFGVARHRVFGRYVGLIPWIVVGKWMIPLAGSTRSGLVFRKRVNGWRLAASRIHRNASIERRAALAGGGAIRIDQVTRACESGQERFELGQALERLLDAPQRTK